MSNKQHIDEVLIYGVDLDKRRIYFGMTETDEGNDFSWQSAEIAIRGMHKMYQLSSAPIEIHMSCPGGDPYEALRLVDEIESAPVQVKFVGGGIIASAATWIMCVCDVRHLHKNSYVMVHDGSEAIEDRHTDVQIESKHSQHMQDRLYDIFEQNSRMPKSFWQDVCQRDLYLSAEEAVLLGLADKVIVPKKRGSVRRARVNSLNTAPDSKTMQKTIKHLYERINRKHYPKIILNTSHESNIDSTMPTEDND